MNSNTPNGNSNWKQVFGQGTPEFVYEDDQCVVYDEYTHPQAPIHFVVVPKNKLPRLADTTNGEKIVLGRLLLTAKSCALKKGLSSGYHVVVDEDFKSHELKALHVFGRALHHMVWPVGPGARL